MQMNDPKHPPAVYNMTNVYDNHTRAFQRDFKSMVSNSIKIIKNVPYKCKNKRINGVYINQPLV